MIPGFITVAWQIAVLIVGGCLAWAFITWLDREIYRGTQRRP